MAQYTVTRVRKELSADQTHRHIAGVCTNANQYYTRKQVVDSIRLGNAWLTYAGGQFATIKPISYCPRSACVASPYITTEPDNTTTNNLENLPEC